MHETSKAIAVNVIGSKLVINDQNLNATAVIAVMCFFLEVAKPLNKRLQKKGLQSRIILNSSIFSLVSIVVITFLYNIRPFCYMY